MVNVEHRIIFFLTLLLLVPAIALAESYSLVMGKAEAVCKHMLQLFNEDLKTFDELKYEKHEEFASIEWTRVLDDYCSRAQMSHFDIDNNGHDDTVLKHEACLRGVLDDNIFVYAEGENAPHLQPHFEFNAEAIKRASGRIGQFPHGMYELRKLPKFREGTAEFYQHIGGLFRMNPFRFDGRYYIVIDNPFQQPRKGGRRFTAIASYESGHLNDICYFATRKFIRRESNAIN